MPYEEYTKEFLERVKSKIQGAIQSKGLSASGDAAASLEILGNELLGNDYIYYLYKGRSPGKFPPVTNIRQWVREKLGIKDKEVNSIAFLIGRKISDKGTSIYQDKSKGIELDHIIEEELDELLQKLPDELVKVDLQKFVA